MDLGTYSFDETPFEKISESPFKYFVYSNFFKTANNEHLLYSTYTFKPFFSSERSRVRVIVIDV